MKLPIIKKNNLIGVPLLGLFLSAANASQMRDGLTDEESETHFSGMHSELQQNILSYLEGRDALAASLVCRQWNGFMKGLSLSASIESAFSLQEPALDALKTKKVNEGIDLENQEDGILAVLPIELSLCVFSLLSREELGRLALVSKHMKALSEHRLLWRDLRLRDRTIRLPSVSVDDMCQMHEDSNSSSASDVLTWKLVKNIQYGPMRLTWSTAPFSMQAGFKLQALELQKHGLMIYANMSFKGEEEQLNHRELFSPSALYELPFPEVTQEQASDWISRINGCVQRGELDEIIWRDLLSHRGWLVKRLFGSEQQTIDGQKTNSISTCWTIHTSLCRLMKATDNSSTLKALQCRQVIGLQNGNYAVFDMLANFDLCDVLHYDWRLAD